MKRQLLAQKEECVRVMERLAKHSSGSGEMKEEMKRSNSREVGKGGGGRFPRRSDWTREAEPMTSACSGWQQVAKRGSSTRETRFLQLCALPSVANCWPPIRLMGSDSQLGSVTLSCNAKPDQQARGGDMRLIERSSEGNAILIWSERMPISCFQGEAGGFLKVGNVQRLVPDKHRSSELLTG